MNAARRRGTAAALLAATLGAASCDDLIEAGRAAFASPPLDTVPSAAVVEPRPDTAGDRRTENGKRPPSTLLGRPAWEGGRTAVGEDLQAIFADEGVEGVVIVHDLRTGATLRSDPERAARRVVPASTFKILNALIALETGVVAGPSDTIRWDGVDRGSDAWNRDHDLRSAFRASAVWYFQELARRIGPDRMASWVRRAGYGNGDVAGAIDRFWLDGPLEISPDEQIGFLRRLRSEELPFSSRSMEIVRELMELDGGDGWTLRGKTGWGRAEPLDHLWFVGWVERGDETAIFAIEFDGSRDRDLVAMRERIYRRALTQLGLVPDEGR